MAKADGGAFLQGVTSGELPVLVTIDNLRCPYAVRAVGQNVNAAFEMKRTFPAGTPLGPVNVLVYNAYRNLVGSAFRGWNTRFGCDNPTQNTCWEVKPTATYGGGTGAANDGKPRDSVFLEFQVGSNVPGRTAGGSAAGYAILPATVNAAPHVLTPSGPTALARTVTFFNSTAADTGHFRYEWAIDGAPVTGASGAAMSTSFATPGTRTITSKALYADLSEVVSTVVIHADLLADIIGPAMLQLGSNGYWSLPGDPGGTAPHSYQWTIDGVVQGYSTDVSTAFFSLGYHSVTATVSDATGYSKSSTIMVEVLDECPLGCNQTRILKAPLPGRAKP